MVLTETYSQLASGALVTEAVIEAQGKKLRCKQVPNPALHAVLNSTHSHDDTQSHDMHTHAILHQAQCFWGFLSAFGMSHFKLYQSMQSSVLRRCTTAAHDGGTSQVAGAHTVNMSIKVSLACSHAVQAHLPDLHVSSLNEFHCP